MRFVFDMWIFKLLRMIKLSSSCLTNVGSKCVFWLYNIYFLVHLVSNKVSMYLNKKV